MKSRYLFRLVICVLVLISFLGCDIDYSVTIGCTPSTKQMDLDGGTFSVELKSYVEWHIESCPTWLSVNPDKGIGDTILTVTVSAGDARRGVVVFDNGYATSKLIVYQREQSEINTLSEK